MQALQQLIIVLTGGIAIWLANDPRPGWQRWACIFGLAGQPIWIYSSWSAGQWGILILAGFYSAAWARGVYTHWIRHA